MAKNTGIMTRFEENAQLLHTVTRGPEVAQGRATFSNYLLGMVMNVIDPAEFASMVLIAESMIKKDVENGHYLY